MNHLHRQCALSKAKSKRSQEEIRVAGVAMSFASLLSGLTGPGGD